MILSKPVVEAWSDTAGHEHQAALSTRIRDLCTSHEELRDRSEKIEMALIEMIDILQTLQKTGVA